MDDPAKLLAQAQEALDGRVNFFKIRVGQDYERAAELFEKAGNAFKMKGNAMEAGNAYEKASRIQSENLKETLEAAINSENAANVYRKVDPKAAARCLTVSVDYLCAAGKFRRAARIKEDLGSLLEVDLGDLKGALECYEMAAGWYDGDNAPALANKSWLKAADLAALESEYYKATEIYERVAEASINNNLMKYSVKEYFLKAGICHLASGDLVAAQRALEKYRDMDPTFGAQREHQLLVNLCESVEAKSQEQFSDRLFQYDQVSKLDKWKTTILVRIKNSIEEADDEFA